MSPKDPDKSAEQESDYDKWFREEVEAALREADDPANEWIPHDVAMKELQDLRAEIEARIAASKKK